METHLVILWEKARSEEARILADLRRHVEILDKVELTWPADPQACFGRFYGAKASLAAGKVLVCGGGAFLLVLVRDRKPRYGWRETSHGSECVNLRMFGMKARYRAWTGGGHRIHTTNSPAEARRDIYLLTGHTLDEWESGVRPAKIDVLPGLNGWPSLRELFRALGEVMPYVVLRNFEMLPDGFDTSVHGDIDLLVADELDCAGALGARKVFPEPYRVHYEVRVDGRPVRFDFRSVGDGYYDSRWERDILGRRVLRDGVSLPCPEDALHMLTYHALLQKQAVASDYGRKVCELARAAGHEVSGFDEAYPLLEKFMAAHGYGFVRPQDVSVPYDPILPAWRELAARLEAELPIRNLQPVFLDRRRPGTELSTMFFSGTGPDGRRVFVKHSFEAYGTVEAEWKYGRAFYAALPASAVRPLASRVDRGGSATIVHEWIEGRMLDDWLAEGTVSPERSRRWALQMREMADALQKLGVSHRDVRPNNIIVDREDRLRLIDFQFATDLAAPRETPFLERSWLHVLFSLGDIYRVARGVWNDRVSFARTMAELPEFPGKWEMVREVRADADRTMRPIRVRTEAFRRLRRELLGPWWQWSNLRRLVRGRRLRETEVTEFLATACARGENVLRRPKTLVIVHVFYAEMWPELAACIRNVGCCDIVITYVDESAVVQARRDFPFARFIACENRGYDVWPFLKAVRAVNLDDFDLVVKLHTKRNLEALKTVVGYTLLNGSAWRDHLLAFVKTPDAWERTLRKFRNPKVGLVADRHVIFYRRDGLKEKYCVSFDSAVRELNEEWGLHARKGGSFVGGTMFAVRARALRPFAERTFSPDMFGASGGHETETYAHVMERMFGLAVGGQGYRVVAWKGSPFWRRVGHVVGKFFWDNRRSVRRHSIRICRITVYLKRFEP